MPKLLAEFLQEQQEPFALEVYLVERGHRRRLNARFTLHNSAKYVAPNCSYFLRTVFNQFVVNGGRKNFLIGGSKSRRGNAAESRCGNCFLEGERKLSPNLISECRLKQQKQQQQQYDEYVINKKVLKQRKQLQNDCRKEVIEKYRKKEKNKEIILGGGEIWKHVWIWSQECINESNLVNLLHSDLLASEDEWNAVFEQNKFQICMEIENAILENVINEIMTLL